MLRWLLRLLLILLALLSLPVLVAGALLLAANTEAGRQFITTHLPSLTAGQVRLQGLEGQLPLAPRIARLELFDDQGLWLAIDQASLDIDPWPLLRGQVQIQALTATSLALERLPVSGADRAEAAKTEEASAPLYLPPMALDQLTIQRLTLGQVVPEAPALRLVTGQARVADARHWQGQLEVEAPDRQDRYQLDLSFSPADLHLDLHILENPSGLITALLRDLGVKLPPEVDRWRLEASSSGPLEAFNLQAKLAAGPLQVSAEGQLDLDRLQASRLHLVAQLPALALSGAQAPPLAWQGIDLSADLSGPWNRPQGQARLVAEGLRYADSGLSRLTAQLEADAQRLKLEGMAQGTRLPQAPAALSDHPWHLTAELAPQEAQQPFHLNLEHPLAHLSIQGKLSELAGQAKLSLTDLSSLASVIGQDLAGQAQFQADFALAADAGRQPGVEASGELRLSRAPAPALALLGAETRLALTATEAQGQWQLASARIDGARFHAGALGCASPTRDAKVAAGTPIPHPPADCATAQPHALGWILDLPDLSVLAPDWSGRFEAQGEFAGWPPPSQAEASTLRPDLSAQLSLDARHQQLGAAKVGGHLKARVTQPSGDLNLAGDWGGQPLALRLMANREADTSLVLDLNGSHLAGIQVSGQMRLPPGATLPQGQVQLKTASLAGLRPLLGPELAGSLDLDLKLTASQARLSLAGQALRLPGATGIDQLRVEGQVADLPALAGIQAEVSVDGIQTPDLGGKLRLNAQGNQQALALTTTATLAKTPIGPANLMAEADLDIPANHLRLDRLETQANGEALRLQAPSTLDFKEGLALDRLRLGLGNGSLNLAGRLLPLLDLEANLDKVALERVAALAGQPLAQGLVNAQIKLKGEPQAPTGNLSLKASGLAPPASGGYGLPAATLDASLSLKPGANVLEVSTQLGTKGNLRLRGQVGGTLPLDPGTLALRAAGNVDLSLLDPLLTAAGRQAAGQANLDAGLAGTLAAPKLEGKLSLTKGSFRDWNSGFSLTGIAGNLTLAGDRLRLDRLSAKAGGGTLALNGDIGLLAPGLPLNLNLSARDAEPIRSDLLSLEADADISLRGPAAAATLAGTTHFKRIDIRLPERLPTSTPTLEVQEQGRSRQPRPPRPEPKEKTEVPFQLALDLRLEAPRRVFLRGQGMDAELGGELQVAGDARDPKITGGFNLLRGEYDLVGQTLRFSRGRIGLDGASLDPTLDLEARVTAAGSTAILGVKGTASTPRIELSGEPELPQDEVLSRLLFGVAGTRLSPWQTAQVGLAAARLAGIGPKGPGLLETARGALGLDRLSVGSDKEGATTAEAGRQLSERVYLGARQGTQAGQTQGVLRIELTPSLKLETDIGASTSGSRVGVAYEKEY